MWCLTSIVTFQAKKKKPQSSLFAGRVHRGVKGRNGLKYYLRLSFFILQTATFVTFCVYNRVQCHDDTKNAFNEKVAKRMALMLTFVQRLLDSFFLGERSGKET